MYSFILHTLYLIQLVNGAALIPTSAIIPLSSTSIQSSHNVTQTSLPHRAHRHKATPSSSTFLAHHRADAVDQRRLRQTRTRRAAEAADTPSPTGAPSDDTTVHINDQNDFALLLPNTPGELVSDAENDGVAYCTPGSGNPACMRFFPEGLIRAANMRHAPDGSWIQVTGCLDTSKFDFAPADKGGQFDVRYPNGAQCTFGGYGASFIEQVEPDASRFCLRCCSSQNDQINCNSHHDKEGCVVAVPGVYDFPGVSCG